MYPFTEDDRLSKLSDTWRDWLQRQVARGCSPASILESMDQAGLAADVTRPALEAARAVCARRFPTSGPVHAGDRTVRIGLTLSDPHVAIIEDLLDAEECETLIEASRSKLQRSTVVAKDGSGAVEPIRTSDEAVVRADDADVVGRIEARIAALTGIPAENGESLHVLRYGPAANYRFHNDFFDLSRPQPERLLGTSGQRIATVLIYLNDVPRGGATVFPKLRLTVTPRRGTAIYFAYFDERDGPDPRLLHGGMPVEEGEKWAATKWLRQRRHRTIAAS